jgi:hypothetical protein
VRQAYSAHVQKDSIRSWDVLLEPNGMLTREKYVLE